MPYLTYEEYKGFGFVDIDESEFNDLIKKASDAIDSVTRHFYQFTDIEADVEFRRTQFKKAIGAQLEHFHETGATTTYAMQEPSTVTIGRTTVSKGGRSNNAQSDKKQSVISDDALSYLRYTGLLYRGVCSC